MTTKFSLNTQLMALSEVDSVARQYYRKAHGSKAEYMIGAYTAVRNTLNWLADHEEEIREWVKVQRSEREGELDAQAARE